VGERPVEVSNTNAGTADKPSVSEGNAIKGDKDKENTHETNITS
jgi:hypothetical protein